MKPYDYQKCLDLCSAYILEHMDEEITAGKLSDLVGYNLSHFSYVFHACTGMTLSDYVRSLRLRNAAKDISEGKTVTFAAMNAGFQTAAGFSKAFSRTFGMSPMDYKRKVKNGSPSLIPLPEIRTEKFRYSALGYRIPGRNLAGKQPQEAAHWKDIDFRRYPGYPEDMNDYAEFAAWVDPDPLTGEMSYFFGCLSDYPKVPDGFSRMEVPDGIYAVINASDTVTCDSPELTSEKMKETAAAVFREWLPSKRNEGWFFDEERPVFELYRKNRAWLYVPLEKADVQVRDGKTEDGNSL